MDDLSTMMVLSLFPGIDLMGRGFEAAGFRVYRGPDLIYGGDIRSFTPDSGVFAGIIAGPPCQDFSVARRTPPTGNGLAMLGELARCIGQAFPLWFLIENVPACPTVEIPGYLTQRLDVYASEFGLHQRRLRHFQFGNRLGKILILERGKRQKVTMPAALASEGAHKARRRDWAAFCALQGFPPLELPGLTLAARYTAVGNGVPFPVSYQLALSILAMTERREEVAACACGCGRPVTGRRRLARGACRQRMMRRRRGCHPAIVRGPGLETAAK